MTAERLDQLRAALWRAVALTLAGQMGRWERKIAIAVAQHVDETLTLSAQLFDVDAARVAGDDTIKEQP